jgi:hypothetical protein
MSSNSNSYFTFHADGSFEAPEAKTSISLVGRMVACTTDFITAAYSTVVCAFDSLVQTISRIAVCVPFYDFSVVFTH